MTEGVHISLRAVDTTACTHCGGAFHATDLPPLTEVQCPFCGKPTPVHGQFGPFLVKGLLGEGGMGAVYRGTDEALDRPVAIKVLRSAMATGAGALDGFRREAQAAARINHDNAAQVFAFGVEDEQPYIVMEFVNGVPLIDFIEKLGALEPRFALHVAIQTAEALNEAATHNLLHGDIKPENILVASNGHAKLIDFGLASFANQTGSAVVWGSPHYIPPERIIRGKRLDFRADIYSLGATLYHALTGRTPFTGSTPSEVAKARLQTVPEVPTAVRPELDAEVSALVIRMMSLSPDGRHPNYTSLIQDMSAILARLGGFSERAYLYGRLGDPAACVKRQSYAETIASDMKTARPGRKAALVVAGVATALTAAGLLTWMFKPSPPPPPAGGTATNRPVMIIEPVALRPANTGTADGASATTGVSARPVPFFAAPDSATTTAGVEVVIDVLANDGNPGNPAQSIVAVEKPEHGVAAIVNHRIAYQPTAGFQGSDSFRYTVKHATGTAKTMVTVDVRASTPPPAEPPPPPEPPKPAAVPPSLPPPSPPPPPKTDPLPTEPLEIRFDTTVMEPYSSAEHKGMGAVIPMAEGKSIKLVGNALKAIPISYDVRTNTVIEFIFASTQIGDVHGVGLDIQTEAWSGDRCFQLYGRRLSACDQKHNNYASVAPRAHRYTIPVGLTHTGAVRYLILLNTGSGQPTPVSEFSDMKIYDFVRPPETKSAGSSGR